MKKSVALVLLFALISLPLVFAHHDHSAPPTPAPAPAAAAPAVPAPVSPAPAPAAPGRPGTMMNRMKGGMMMPPVYSEFKLDKESIDRIEAILTASEKTITTARAEIGIIQSRIARHMLESAPDMEAIRTLIKESLEWEAKVRMAQLERQVEIRSVVGEPRWNWLFRMNREFRQMPDPGRMIEMMNRNGMKKHDIEEWSRLFKLLKRLN